MQLQVQGILSDISLLGITGSPGNTADPYFSLLTNFATVTQATPSKFCHSSHPYVWTTCSSTHSSLSLGGEASHCATWISQ